MPPPQRVNNQASEYCMRFLTFWFFENPNISGFFMFIFIILNVSYDNVPIEVNLVVKTSGFEVSQT